jgi:hypothetical protein
VQLLPGRKRPHAHIVVVGFFCKHLLEEVVMLLKYGSSVKEVFTVCGRNHSNHLSILIKCARWTPHSQRLVDRFFLKGTQILLNILIKTPLPLKKLAITDADERNTLCLLISHGIFNTDISEFTLDSGVIKPIT